MKKESKSIKDWHKDNRPREKMIHQGKAALTDVELLAILINTGYKGVSALEIADRLLEDYQYNLHELSKIEFADLIKRKGFGEAKAIKILATIELSNRRAKAKLLSKPQLNSSQKVYDFINPKLKYLAHEEFWVVYLNRKNKVLKSEKIAQGGMSMVGVDVRLIFKKALEVYAHGIIIVHNHPSDELTPSPQDEALTKKIKEIGQWMEILLLDHLIIGSVSYYSFADHHRL